MKKIHEMVLFMHWQLMGPMNNNNAYYWVHLMCKELFMLRMIILRTFRYSMRPNFSALVIIQAMIMTKYRIVARKDIREVSIPYSNGRSGTPVPDNLLN